jgi:hypothetical protein
VVLEEMTKEDIGIQKSLCHLPCSSLDGSLRDRLFSYLA